MPGYMNNPYQQNFMQNPYQMPAYQPPMQDRLAQLQNNYQNAVPMYGQIPQQQMVQQLHLNGQMVDSIDVVKAKDVDLSGAVTYYPKADLSEIYTKQLMADGTSRIVTYKAIPQETPQPTVQQPVPVTYENIHELFGQLKTELLGEINGIKEMLPALSGNTAETSPRTTKGGSKA